MTIPGSANERVARRRQIALVAGGVVVVLGLIVALVLAVSAMVRNPQGTETVRDIVIIFVAGETLLVGVALILLLVQLARLTALLQNEIRPLLESTNETVATLRGTSEFLSQKLVSPVIKANSSMAVVRRAIGLFRAGRIK
jgi:flagellar biogenesis protein FliO